MLERYTDEELQDIAAQLLLEAIVEGRLDSDDEEIAHAQEVGLSLGLELGLADFAKRLPKMLNRSTASLSKHMGGDPFANMAHIVRRDSRLKQVIRGRAKQQVGAVLKHPATKLIGGAAAVGAGVGVYNSMRSRPNSGNGIVKSP